MPVVCNSAHSHSAAIRLTDLPVHCRRRKIRCLLATDDPQSRCSNCIRLKKACNFFPVDQQPANERRPRTGSKIETKDSGGSASSSSSPKISTSRAEDQADTFTQFQAPLTAYPPSAASINSAMVSPPGSAGTYFAPFTARRTKTFHSPSPFEL